MGALGSFVFTDSRNMDVILSSPKKCHPISAAPSATAAHHTLGSNVKNALCGFPGFALVVLAMFCGGPTSSRAADVSSHQSRYIYCNVYLDDVCFGIASGDALDMRIPADFVLYTVSLGTGVKVEIYSGDNPQDDAFNSPQIKHCTPTDSTGKCLYVKSRGTFDLLYQANPNASFLHLHLTGIQASNADDINDFLANFRGCKPVDQSIQCTNERIFKGITL